MRLIRFVCSFAVSVSAILMIGLVAILSNPVIHANQPSALADLQRLPLTAPRHLAAAGQKPPVSFAKAAAYSSGGRGASSVAIGDLNGDGHPDLVVADVYLFGDDTVSVLLGNGDGTYQSPVAYTTGSHDATSVAIGDVNGDGRPDLVVASYCQTPMNCPNGGVSVLLGNGDGTFQAPASYSSGGYQATSVAIGDVNGDGKLDLVVANACQTVDQEGYCTGPIFAVSVLLGNGDGTFQSPVSYMVYAPTPSAVVIGDVNGDGKLDLVVASYCQTEINCGNGGVSVLLGNGDGTFQSPTSYSSGGYEATSVAIGDVNGDGYPDVVVGNSCPNCGDGVSALLGNGDGTFQAPVTYSVCDGVDSVKVGDVNGDGHPDLVVTNYPNICGQGKKDAVSVLLGNGDGTFQSPVSFGAGGYPAYSVAIADLNSDGKLDVVAANGCAGSGCRAGSIGVLLNNFTAKTTTNLQSSPNPSQVSQPVTFTAAVKSKSSVPDGSSVTFYNGATEIGTGTTTNGVASLTTSFSTAGKYTVEASYSGDAFHDASLAIVKQVVNP
jgi:hypothetical protein